MAVPENKLGITSAPELAEAEERISKKKAVELFENGLLDKLEAGKIASLQIIHKCLLGEIRKENISKGNSVRVMVEALVFGLIVF